MQFWPGARAAELRFFLYSMVLKQVGDEVKPIRAAGRSDRGEGQPSF